LLVLGCNVNTFGTGAENGSSAEDDDDDDELDEEGVDSDVPTDCGNGAIDPGEECDGAALGGSSCMALGWDHGALGCTNACEYDLGDCGNDPQPGPGELYSACMDNGDCPGLDGCLTLTDEFDTVIDGFCTNLCLIDDECMAPTGGNAVPICRVGSQSTHCALDCSDGLTCPDTMTCQAVEGGGELCF
jgi:hypothetical protein